jgi:phosphatidylinositol alpha-mannosyltransferase
MRICMVTTYDVASPGGVKHHALHLADALRRLGDEVTLVGPSSAVAAQPGIHTFGGVVNIAANGSDNFMGLLVPPLSVARFFRHHQFDLIHVHEPLLPALSYWSVWSTRNTPHVATFHAYAEAEAGALTLARRLFGGVMWPWFQGAIAVSGPAAQYARCAWRRPMTIIPNGVSTGLYRPPQHGQTAHSPQPVRLLFVGRLGDPRKGGPVLFAAFRELLARGLPVTLDVVGELGHAAPPPALPGLQYHGAIDAAALVRLYQECDVFVAPATGQESFGMVLLEAMACAKPIVCSDIAGYRQVVNSESAALVPPGDVRALAAALELIVKEDPASRRLRGERNRSVAARYDWQIIAARVREEYGAAIKAFARDARNLVAGQAI